MTLRTDASHTFVRSSPDAKRRAEQALKVALTLGQEFRVPEDYVSDTFEDISNSLQPFTRGPLTINVGTTFFGAPTVQVLFKGEKVLSYEQDKLCKRATGFFSQGKISTSFNEIVWASPASGWRESLDELAAEANLKRQPCFDMRDPGARTLNAYWNNGLRLGAYR